MKNKIFFAKALFLPALLVLCVGCQKKPTHKTTVASPDVTESKEDTAVFQEHVEKEFRVDVYMYTESLSDEPNFLGRTSLADMEKFSIPENSKWFIRPTDKNINDEYLLLFLRKAADFGIRGLSLRECREFTNAGLAHLKNLTELERLNLADTRITDAGLAHLKNLTALKRLNLEVTQITDAGLAHLKNMTSLESLKLPVQITDAGLVHLKNMTALESLNLTDTRITDAGLAHLKNMTSVERLNLPRQITDAGLAHLKNLTSLKRLDLSETQITDAGLKDFRTARPDVWVWR